MDRWLSKAPALAHIKPRLWAVFNNRSEPILWTEDPQDAAWYLQEIQLREGESVEPPRPTVVNKKYKRSAYGLPPRWHREEFAKR
jgi:hypothetical protein